LTRQQGWPGKGAIEVSPLVIELALFLQCAESFHEPWKLTHIYFRNSQGPIGRQDEAPEVGWQGPTAEIIEVETQTADNEVVPG
jgi:hypothetical protein